MDVQLSQLACFVGVAEARHFSRAAERLHLAQPSVSRQVRLLERELGVRLFHRGQGVPGVELTTEGETLLPWARRVLADVEATTAEARSLAGLEAGKLRLGATPSLSTSLLPAALARLHARHPGIGFSLVESGSLDLSVRLADGELDLALVTLPVGHPLVGADTLFDEALVVVVEDSHPLAGRAEVAVAELAEHSLVMFREGYDLRVATLQACARAGVSPRLLSEGGDMDCVLALVRAGLGAAVVPRLVLGDHPGLRAVPFAAPGLWRRVGLAYRRDRPLSRAAQALQSIVAELAGYEGAGALA